MVRVIIQGNVCHATSHTATAPHDRIHSNAGTKATVKFLPGPTRVCWASRLVLPFLHNSRLCHLVTTSPWFVSQSMAMQVTLHPILLLCSTSAIQGKARVWRASWSVQPFCITHGCALWSPPDHGSVTVYRDSLWSQRANGSCWWINHVRVLGWWLLKNYDWHEPWTTTIRANACHATSRTTTAPHNHIHDNTGTTAILKFLKIWYTLWQWDSPGSWKIHESAGQMISRSVLPFYTQFNSPIQHVWAGGCCIGNVSLNQSWLGMYRYRRTIDAPLHHWRSRISGSGFTCMEQPDVERHLVNVIDCF